MSTRELLKQFKTLGAREQEKFIDALLGSKGSPGKSASKSTKVRWPNVEKRAVQIAGTKLASNLVLLERDEESH